jgi:lipocalin-like protein
MIMDLIQYEIKDNTIIHHIDISWNEKWSGTDQVRYYKLEGNHLTLIMAPFNDPKYGKIHVRLVWEKMHD